MGLMFIICGIIGVTLAALIVLRDVSLETIASVGVAVGTVGLAYFTWRSVVRTGDLIGSEDRRHQQGFAPLLLIPDVASLGVHRVTFQNVGMGMARNIAVYIIGTYCGANFTAVVSAVPPDLEGQIWQGYYSVIPPPPNVLSTLQDAPMQDAPDPPSTNYVFAAQQVFVTYEDMFGNPYSTVYENYANDKSFEWQQPERFKSFLLEDAKPGGLAS